MVMALSLLKNGSGSGHVSEFAIAMSVCFSELSVSSQVHLPDNKKPAGVSGLFLQVLNLLSDYRYSNDHTPACQGVCHHQMVRDGSRLHEIESCKRCLQ